MAYAALVSLEQSLCQTTLLPHLREQIQSLLPKIEYLLKFLEDSSHQTHEKTSALVTKIRDASYRAQYRIDLYCYDTEMAIIRHVPKPKNVDLWENILEFQEIESDIRELTGSPTEEAKNTESRLAPKDLQLQNPLRAGSPTLDSEDVMVGFEDLFLEIKEELLLQQSELEFVSVVGMGGVGKTTLARKIYSDSLVRYHFDTCAWVVASQSLRNILFSILHSMNVELSDEMAENELKERLSQILKQKRYLVIIDDIWDTTFWDEMRKVLPNNKYGSRVLVTTRLAHVAAYVSSSGHSHHVPLLSSEESWTLLHAKVFGDKKCPPELQQLGQKISERCGGLPLSLVVMGGLLSEIDKTKELWLNFERNVTSAHLYQCLEILKLTYDYMPQRLKPCFLYMAHFQEDEEIPVSKLIKLWVAEGFLKQVQHQDPEAVAEKCLMELVDHSMILVSKHTSESNIKTCRMHRLLHDLCVREANKEKFLNVRTPTYVHTFEETPHDPLRISIHSKTPNLILSDSISSFSFVRSLFYTGSGEIFSSVFLKFKLLRVLDATKAEFSNFPSELLELLNLRYISFKCQEHIPASISNLQHLQTLIIRQEHGTDLPEEIWDMTHLRHIELEEGSLPNPISTQLGIDGSPLVLKYLHTLSGIRNFRFTEEVLARIPSIERLKVSYDTINERKGWSFYEFQNLFNLKLLKSLKIYIHYGLGTLTGSKFEFQFPPSLQELTLGGCSISWEDLSVVGCLPNLEVLKLRYGSCLGDTWRPNEGEFPRLKLLLLQSLNLVHWEVEDVGIFPCLEQLILRDCYALEKIPDQIKESPTLMMIELDKSNDSVLDSAKKIQKWQRDLGNDDFLVIIRTAKKSSSNSLIHPKILKGHSEIMESDAECSDYFDSTSESYKESKQQKTRTPASRGPLVVDSSSFAWNHESFIIGFHEDISHIKNWLAGSTHHLELMEIVGMAGIGKTTLARTLFESAVTDYGFDIHVWLSVSRTNDVQKMIRGVLDSMRSEEDELDDKSVEQLTGILYKRLEGKRYLIILDDVWDIQFWDDIKRSFPDDNTRSRIIMTTRPREMDIKIQSAKVHLMSCLPPKVSQTLFYKKVFGEEECPQDLESVARDILGNCRQLPLAIVAIGGLLSKVGRNKDDWQLISKTMNSTIASKGHLSGIMSLCYNYLPLNLRPNFRSMMISAEDHELSVPQLVRLWINEGLVDKIGSRSPEEVAEDVLKDLIDRSFIMVYKRNKMGEVETCSIPCIWRDYFVANDPDILQILLSKSNQSTALNEGMENPPRSYSKGVSIEEDQKGKINHDENEISMAMLFNNIYTKDCIRFCSLFPTTFEFSKDILTSLWIAQGWTVAGNDAFIEEACIQCFDILLNAKYIFPTGYDLRDDQIKYKVGDEMHTFLQKHHHIQLQFSKELDSKHIERSKLEHLSLYSMEIGQINFEIIKKLSRLQTLIIHGCYGFKVTHLPSDMFMELKSLRILILSHTDVVELPSSIKSSNELRYLDMSETPIRWLPESMGSLTNLQTLKLDNCLDLVELPERMKEWINLRHLILDVARQLQFMPEGIGNLSKLRTLRAFLVGEEHGYSINELKHMNNLSGSIRILKLENIKTPDQAADASLSSKQDLKKIELEWSDVQDEKNPIEEEILTCLEPPLGIKELKILYYSGGRLPSWIGKSSFSEMVSITLYKCRYCIQLPSLGQLPSLKFLNIIGMNEVLEINSLFCGEPVYQHQPSFPVVEKLSFYSMSRLERWTEIRMGDFPRLMNLTIESCPKINCLPILSHLNSLMHMVISYCPELSCLPDGKLPSTLESLMIKDCPKLEGRCSSDEAEDWSKIDHVSILYIGNMKIQTKK